MRNFIVRVLPALIAVSIFFPSFSQTRTNTDILKQAAAIQATKEKKVEQQLQTLVSQKGWDKVKRDNHGNIAILVGVDDFGMPQYLITENNILAAATIGTSALWPGGSTGLNLSGSSAILKDKLAIWDGGKVRSTHVELAGRVVQRDNSPTIEDHSTHVAGTLIAAGVNPLAKGMSFGEQELVAYDFNNHLSEMLTEAPNLLISNHSYGSIAGWYHNDAQNRDEFWGQSGANEDYKFGYYSSEAQVFDSIAYNAPYYLIVKSAGNNRNENGPSVGSPYWRYDANGVMSNAGNRPAGISNNDSYDIIPTYGTAKNILVIGAVNPLPSGYSKPSDVVLASFSSWGPTDDGRIKPDVVADGVNLLSSIGTADNAYDTYSGTSMATPNAAGSLLLLQEYYSRLHAGAFMRSATLRGLVIHTADEAGASPGPDYQNGWGLIDMKKAAAVITANNTTDIMQENSLDNAGNASYSLPVIASGNGTISATICWTDPKGAVEPVATALNNPTPKLINDLDIVIKKGATVYHPWVLTPSNPGAPATTGDNVLDNVEKVELPDVVPGDTYTIQITHKGTLARGQQAYSLIASGVGGHAYCTSGPTSTGGARIDSVSFANIQNKNVAGCTSYSNFTGLTASLQPGQTIPIFIALNSCDASAVDKIVKVYIDANNDGDFDDAGENIATSTVINGNGNYSGSITVPAGLTPGKYTLLRIVMEETSTAANVSPCGTYTKGETQDYRVLISAPSRDVGITGLVSPLAADCGSGVQYVTVRIRNFGTADTRNIALSTVISQGSTIITTLTHTFIDTIFAGTEATYTYQTPFISVPGATYTFTSNTSLAGDQDPSNDQNIATVTINPNGANPAGTAVVCGNSALLTVNPVTSDIYTWYTSSTATSPIAYGSNSTTSTIAPAYYVERNDNNLHIGPTDKLAFPSGSYLQFGTNTQLRTIFTTEIPLTIETARLYIGQAGTITLLLRKITNFNFTNGSYSYYPDYDQAYVVNAYATSPTTPVPGTTINDPADLGAIYNLGINVPTAGTWAIIVTSTGNASFYRNNAIASNPYPFTLPGIMSITGDGAVDNTNPNLYQQYYYFFYDINVKTGSCPSNRVAITPTTVTTPVISINGNLLTSTSATSYQWYLNGVIIPGATSQSYTATASGSYIVQVSDATGLCSLQSNSVNFSLTAVTNVDPSEIGLIVSPNPTTNGQFNLQLETRTRANLYISLVNTLGQKVYQYDIPDFSGRLSQLISPARLPAGLYYLQVQHDKKMYVKKIVVSQ
ncbi:MAG: S8 family serine peptidase [Bacteroidota bacterium]|nr:S8 family serine peptidase [Bacteroidota bacterium]